MKIQKQTLFSTRALSVALAASGLSVGVSSAQTSDGSSTQTSQKNDDISAFVETEEESISTELYLNFDFHAKEDANGDMKGNFGTQESYLLFSAKLSEHIRAYLSFKLEKILYKDGESEDVDFDVGEFIEDAYIEIRLNEDRKPVALIIGKHTMAFGSFFSDMPAYYNNPFFKVTDQGEHIGFTVALEDWFGFDMIEASLFETEAGDLEIGSFDGASIRLSKSLNSDGTVQAVGSAMYKGNGSRDDAGSESAATLGLIYLGPEGLTVWGEALVLKDNPIYPEGDVGLQAGISKEMGPGRVVGQVSWLVDSFTQLAAGYDFYITKNTAAGFEVRYTFTEDGSSHEDGLSVGANLKMFFAKENDIYNNPLFKGAEGTE